MAPRSRRAERTALYVHGGAYISGIAPQHWQLISRLTDAGVRVEVPAYGLAPQSNHREAYPFLITRGERVVLVWDGLSAPWSRAMRAWVAEQDWLTLERLPAYAPELNPVELLSSSLKKRELANLAGDHLADVADATEQGIHRINANPRLPRSFLAHTGLTIRPPHPPNLQKDQ
ncbi:transposase [Streptomyces virginiae]|uniref:transposase n=1 Tax=Streptomyces virginiae TaxID=1961 RepID=UPI003421CD50